jgi:hypothetical protein
MTSFVDSVNTDKPAIYHILDGFLGKGIDGYKAILVNKYLTDNNLNDINKADQVI